jgi:hypothetical protein
VRGWGKKAKEGNIFTYDGVWASRCVPICRERHTQGRGLEKAKDTKKRRGKAYTKRKEMKQS